MSIIGFILFVHSSIFSNFYYSCLVATRRDLYGAESKLRFVDKFIRVL